MEFRDRLLSTLRAIQPILLEPGVLVAGSEVPNLLEPDVRASLVVSQDVDIAIPVDHHAAVKALLHQVTALEPSAEEPSVWLPKSPELIEVNFIGMSSDSSKRGETFVFEDDELPLLVFGHLSLLEPGKVVHVEGLTIPLPKIAGLTLEKLLTDRTGEKGDRDLLVALGLVLLSSSDDLDELEASYRQLQPELCHTVRSNLSLLSLIQPRAEMPDPTPHRLSIARLLARLEKAAPPP